MRFLPPPRLRSGSRVRVVAPAGPFDRPGFEAGVALLRKRYDVRFDDGIFSAHRYLAGNDARRLEELRTALADDETEALFSARGGYGSMRLLPGIRFDGHRPKLVVGFSDLTAVHGALQSVGRISVHAPVLTQLGKQPAHAVQRFFDVLESTEPAPPLDGTATFVSGLAEGPLLGGNLSVFTRLLGTKFMPDLNGAVLLLEDVTERPYRLDRMWTHLQLAGVFEQVSGIVLGDFTGCEEKDAPYTSLEILRELAQAAGVPCAAGFRIGHDDVNLAVPLGARVRLDADARRLEFLEPAVTDSPALEASR